MDALSSPTNPGRSRSPVENADMDYQLDTWGKSIKIRQCMQFDKSDYPDC